MFIGRASPLMRGHALKMPFGHFTNKPFSLFIIAVALMVAVCKRDAAKENPFGLRSAFCFRRLRNRVIVTFGISHSSLDSNAKDR